MAGPFFLMFLSLESDADQIGIARKVAKYGAEYGFGLTFGDYQVRQVLEHNRDFVEAVLRDISRPFPILVASYPGENDVMDLFEEQLNISRGVNPSRSTLLKFLDSTWAIQGIDALLIAIWDSGVPTLGSTPEYRMAFKEFIHYLENYYSRQVTGLDAEGIFRIWRSNV